MKGLFGKKNDEEKQKKKREKELDKEINKRMSMRKNPKNTTRHSLMASPVKIESSIEVAEEEINNKYKQILVKKNHKKLLNFI